MSGSLGKSDSQSGNKFNQNIWGPQGDALQNMYGQLGGLFNQSNQGMQNQIPGAVNNMQSVFNQSQQPWQQQMQGGAFAGMDLQGMYGDALNGGGNEQFMNESIMGGAGNNYVDAMKNQMQQDSGSRLGQNLAMNDARNAGNQLSGSSRHGLAEQGIYDQSEQNLGRMQTELGYNTFDKDMDRKMDIARNADAFDMNKINSLSGALTQQQGAMANGLNQGGAMQGLGMGQFAPYMAPWQMSGQYSNALGRPTTLGSGSGSSDSKGFGMSGGAK